MRPNRYFMMPKKPLRRLRLPGMLLVILVFGVGFKQLGDYFEVSRNMEIFGKLYIELNQTYVDEPDPTGLMRTAIDSMLASLDPYTNYFSESQIDESKLIRTGQYSGIGAELGKRQGKVLILQLFEDGPADKGGLQVGDELVQIDNIEISEGKRSLEEIETILSGERGSAVRLLIRKPKGTALVEKTVIRGGQNEAEKENVPFFGMVNDTVGYILLSGFTQNAGGEVADALTKLRQENQALNRLILDLRSNPGGILQEAVNIVNIFVPQGELVAEMRGRTHDTQRKFHTMTTPLDEDLPLAVLVNGRSASASEIVSGAIQDLDRGVIVGQRSFGKGLVQNFRPLVSNTQMKITIAKYYIPSGRCIQAIDYFDEGKDRESYTAFQTKNGRTVYDGAGVYPDVPVEHPPLKPVTKALVDQGLIFDFVTVFSGVRKEIPGPREYEVSDETYDAFLLFVREQGFTFDTQTEAQLEKVRQALTANGYSTEDMQNTLGKLESQLQQQKAADLETNAEEIKALIKEEIISRYYYKQGVLLASFEDDPDILTALEVLNDGQRYREILSP
jgi:carboxyl-terminal processing protease